MRRPPTTTQSRNLRPRVAARILSRLVLLGLAGAGLTGHAVSAAEPASEATSDHAEAPEGWRLYLGPEVGLQGNTGKGNQYSSLLTGPRVANPRPRLGDLSNFVSDPTRSREQILSALVGGTFGVMTPELLSSAGRPRLFLDVNISAPMADEVHLARRQNPGVVALPEPRSPSFPAGEGTLTGIGTQMTVVPQGPQVHAGFGPAFEMNIGGERIRLKPAVVYSRTILDVKVQTKRAVRLNEDAGAANTLDDYRLIELKDSMREVYHGVGPALEVEYEPELQLGPFSLTLYAKVHASYLFGDLKTNLQQANPDPAAPGETGSWKYTQDRWVYRASTGLRFTWTPKSHR